LLKYKTVFVLGAGASMPYGFPSGMKLLEAAKNLTMDDLAGMDSSQGDRRVHVGLLAALSGTQEESIDAMLETQPENVQAAGKRIIAAEILSAESKVRKYLKELQNSNIEIRDWFSHLFSRMAEGVTTLKAFFEGNDVNFVTYNYDRLVEQKMMSGLQAKYHASEADWALVTGRVIHLHGSAGELHGTRGFQVPWAAGAGNGASHAHVEHCLSLAANSILIVHELAFDAEAFQRARAVLSQADRVFFLGFGFGRTNVDRLDFSNIKRSAVIRFTRWGLTDQEMGLYIHQPLKKASIGNYSDSPDNWDCLALIRQNIGALVDRY
jgi:hypothetical protein